MKAFRGTLLALVALLALLGAWWMVRPVELTPAEKKAALKGVEKPIFVFEKANLVKVEVTRPEGTIVLAERADGWWLEGEELRASRSMVNRVKHQLHDLVARATVVDGPADDALYGLGTSTIHVKLTFRDGSTEEFDAGDPNPSGVSFYIRKTGDTAVYTVKKSAVDYYSLSLAEFRERRFASFDSKDVDALAADLPGGKRLAFQRTGERSWDMLEPRQFAANDSEIRGLLGRVSALKAIQFVTDDDADLAKYGLAQPRARITIRFSGREPLTLLLGAPTGEKDGEYVLAYVKLLDEPTIYAARDGLLEDYEADTETFRLKRFARMDPNTLASLVTTFSGDERDPDLTGTVTVKMEADKWFWDTGVPVPGSTPKRLATRVANVQADEFVAEAATNGEYGFEKPLATIVMNDRGGESRTIVVGKGAPPLTDPEGHERERFYARAVEFPEVYIIDSGVVDVVKDLMREHRRKATGDAEKTERRDRIDQERGGAAVPPGAPK
ncbi:MAG: DUF4340 domain-containing protein [Pseudomonadota bacterium]|nr:DUF4340 domain-containing protein [Pseudomonadota bacterium]